MRSILISVISLLLISSVSFAEDSGVDWNSNIIKATGFGIAKSSGRKVRDKMMALRAAKVTAMRDLMEIVQGVRVDSETVVNEAVLKKDEVRTKVQGVIRGCRVMGSNVKYDDNGDVTAEVVLGIALNGAMPSNQNMPDLLSALSPELIQNSPAIPNKEFSLDEGGEGKKELVKNELAEIFGEEPRAEAGMVDAKAPIQMEEDDVVLADLFGSSNAVSEPMSEDEPKFSTHTEYPSITYDPAKPATGVLVIVEGTPFVKGLCPVLAYKDESGELESVYSAKNVEPEIIRTSGIVWYVKDVDTAQKLEKLGDNILVIKSLPGPRDCMLLVDKDTAWQLAEQKRQGSEFAKKGAVVICAK
ncbi:LPP20 family lipoprotein [Maridesulfovibrio zosterae]|uniref:LPP20 family lipoprotein n=1 Tax=Maridesulfovibrio zosterae TaxID=82171 RepID=UPI00041E01BD|nr:LPP20 family lipoprotein [Maridesulfovibrio zosterae]